MSKNKYQICGKDIWECNTPNHIIRLPFRACAHFTAASPFSSCRKPQNARLWNLAPYWEWLQPSCTSLTCLSSRKRRPWSASNRLSGCLLKSEESSLIILLVLPFQVSFAGFTFYTCSLTCDGLALRFRRREFGCWKSASFLPLARLNFSRVRGYFKFAWGPWNAWKGFWGQECADIAWSLE